MNLAGLYAAKLNQEFFIEVHIIQGQVDNVTIHNDFEKAKKECIEFWDEPLRNFDIDVDNTQIWSAKSNMLWSYAEHYMERQEEERAGLNTPAIPILDADILASFPQRYRTRAIENLESSMRGRLVPSATFPSTRPRDDNEDILSSMLSAIDGDD